MLGFQILLPFLQKPAGLCSAVVQAFLLALQAVAAAPKSVGWLQDLRVQALQPQ